MKKMDRSAIIFRGLAKLALFFFLIVTLIPLALIIKRLLPKYLFKLPQLFHFLLLKILNIKLLVRGEPATSSPILFVANHASYLDIPVIGSLLQGSFVAKSEVESWPLFGFLSNVQNTIFIERRSTRAVSQRKQLEDHLAKGQNLILFPEGTSSHGLTVLRFKSSLFSIVEEFADKNGILVQPISLICVKYKGKPITHEERDLYAWHGDMTLAPHLWNVFKRGAFLIEVNFHIPLKSSDYPDRKALALACQNEVLHGIKETLKREKTAS